MKLLGICNKRFYLARILEQTGVLGLLERVVATHRPALFVFTYHRIADHRSNLFYDPVISAAPQSFRAQIEWLRKQMPILTLDDFHDRIQTGRQWKETAAFITFDDGYRDNFDVAIPILNELGVPATFFIPTEFLESPKLPWWDHVAYVIKETSMHRLELKCTPDSDDTPLVIELDHIPREAAITAIIRAILADEISDLGWFLDEFTIQADVSFETESLGRTLFMGWDQVQQLADYGNNLTIGSHAHSHDNLAKLDAQSQQRELLLSKQVLEQHLGYNILAIAYPFGWPGSYTPLTERLAREAGYQLAFNSRFGVNRYDKVDPYEINRLAIGFGDSLSMLRARAAMFSAFDWSLV